MNSRELFLLSPYQVPAQNALSLADDDAAAFLNGWSVLWHPLALDGAAGPPKIASSYDHEQPTANRVYAVPQSPPLFLPDDWEQRVTDGGAVAIKSGPDRQQTFHHLRESHLGKNNPDLAGLPPEVVAPFLAIGLGFLMVNTLFDAMEHENLLASADLWQDVQDAVGKLRAGDPAACRQHLQQAAERLVNAREILYPSLIYVIDVCLLDENRLDESFPAAFDQDQPINIIASVGLLEKLGRDHPERLHQLRERFCSDRLELCSGSYLEREDALLPMESQLWNLLKGCQVFKKLVGSQVRVHGRKRFAWHPQVPMLLNQAGISKAIVLSFDNGVLPTWRSAVVSWPSPDGKQIEAFVRTPYPADSPNTFFHLAHYLHKTIRQDQAATFALLHREKPAAPWYCDWLELTALAPVFGQWYPLSRYFAESQASEYISASSPDEFHSDYLEERTTAKVEQPVGWFARQVRLRRRLDSAWTLAGIYRGLAGKGDATDFSRRLRLIEDSLESAISTEGERELDRLHDDIVKPLAARLLARAKDNQPGYLLLNPCSFTRRIGLELDDVKTPLPIEGPVKACQIDPDKARLIVEVPPLGFTWFPRGGPPGTPPMKEKIKLADERGVRNEFFDAEVDFRTGGLQALRDLRLRANRLGQILTFNPGSRMRCEEVRVTCAGAVLGEVVSSGTLRGEQDQVLAKFKQRFRAWHGRPILEIQIELTPLMPPAGYPWHAYFAARFNWGDERAILLRGVNGIGYISSHTRPETPDFIEIRSGPNRTAIFPGGLPFTQRQGTRMLDVILVPEGETTQTFELALGLDREHLMHTALGIVTPVAILPTTKGPPHVGSTGWLFHLDAQNLLLTSMRPAADGNDALFLRMLEVANHSGPAELRCVRNPVRASVVDARGEMLFEGATRDDGVSFEETACDVVQLLVSFTEEKPPDPEPPID